MSGTFPVYCTFYLSPLTLKITLQRRSYNSTLCRLGEVKWLGQSPTVTNPQELD